MCSIRFKKALLPPRVSVRQLQMQGFMVKKRIKKKKTPWMGLQGEFCLVHAAMYVWMHQLLCLALSGIHFMQGYWRCQLVHLELRVKGFWRIVPLNRTRHHSHIQQPAPCSALCPLLYPTVHRLNLWGLYQPNENYIHARATPAYTAYIMQQMSIGGQGV